MRFLWLVQLALILLLPPLLYLLHPRRRGSRERSLKAAGLILAGTSALIFGSFLAGELMADPGGWAGAGWIAAWLLPLTGLALLAWYRPALATLVLAVLMVGVVALYAWSAIVPDAWDAFEDAAGPIRAIISFVIAVPATLLGWKRPTVAGAILLALPLLPAIVVAIGAASGWGAMSWPLAMVAAPAGITGILYLLSAAAPKGSPPKPEKRPWPPSAKPRSAAPARERQGRQTPSARPQVGS